MLEILESFLMFVDFLYFIVLCFYYLGVGACGVLYYTWPILLLSSAIYLWITKPKDLDEPSSSGNAQN